MCGTTRRSEMKEGPYQEALADIALRKVNRYFEANVPIENRFIRRVDRMGDPDQMNLAGGLATDAVSRQFDPVLTRQTRVGLVSGLAPNSGAFMNQQATLRATGADTLATADVGARMGQKGRYLAGLQTVSGMGHSLSTQAQMGMTDLANMEADQAKANAQAEWESDAGLGSAAGTAIGIGIGKTLDRFQQGNS